VESNSNCRKQKELPTRSGQNRERLLIRNLAETIQVLSEEINVKGEQKTTLGTLQVVLKGSKGWLKSSQKRIYGSTPKKGVEVLQV
jgi:hypothetical protein